MVRVAGAAKSLPFVVLLLTACTPKFELPQEVLITCTADGDCPSGSHCRAAIGRCVVIGGEETPPALAGTAQVTPSIGTYGTVFKVSFTVDEPLFADPVVRIQGSTAGLALDEEGTDRASLRYAFVYTPVKGAAAAEGTVALEAVLVDRQGNRGTAAAGTFTLDLTPPAVTGLDWRDDQGRRAARPSETLRFGATTEAGAKVLKARLLSSGGTALADLTTAVKVQGTSVPKIAELLGSVDLSKLSLTSVDAVVAAVEVADAAGNSSGEVRTSVRAVDAEAPAGGAVRIQGQPTLGSPAASLEILPASGATEMWIEGDVVDDEQTFAWIDAATEAAVLLTSGDGDKTVRVRFRDDAWNEGAEVSDTIALDTGPVQSAPTLAPPPGQGAVKPGDLLLVGGQGEAGASVISARLLDVDTALTALDLPSGAVTIDRAGSLSGALTVTSLPGVGRVALEVVLAARGRQSAPESSRSLPVVVDAEPPQGFAVASVRGPLVNASKVTLSLSAIGATRMRLMGDLVPGAGVDAWVPFATTAEVDLAGGDGAKTILAFARDDAFNEASVTLQVRLDTAPPVVVPILKPPAGQTALKNGDTVAFSGQTEKGATLESARLVREDDSTALNLGVLVAVGPDGELSGSATLGTLAAQSLRLEVIVRDGVNASAPATSRSAAVPVLAGAPSGLSVSAAEGARVGTLSATVRTTVGGASEMRIEGDVQAGAATFAWLPLAASRGVTLSDAEGEHTVTVQVRDEAHHEATASFKVTVDRVAPQSAPTLAAPAGQTAVKAGDTLQVGGTAEPGSQIVSARLIDAGGAPLADLAGTVQVNAAGVFSGTAVVPASASGQVAVEVVATDGLNASAPASSRSQTLVVDGDAPTSLGLRIQGGPVVGGSDVTVETSAVGATEVFLGGDVVESSSTLKWVPLTAQRQVTLKSGDGTRVVSARYRDGAFNVAGPITDSIYVNGGAVVSAPTLAGPAGQAAIKTGDTLTVGGSGEPLSTVSSARLVDVSTGATVLALPAGTVVITSAGALSGSFAAAGMTTGQSVAVEVVLHARGIDSVPAASRSLPLAVDLAPPGSVSVSVAQGAKVPAAQVTLAIAAVGAAEMFLDGDLADGTGVRAWVPLATSAAVALRPFEGAHDVRLSVRDGAHNVVTVQTSVALDTLAPASLPTLAPPAGQGQVKNGDTLSVGGSAEPGTTLVSARLVDPGGATVAVVTGQVSLDATTGALSGAPTLGTVSAATVALEVVVTDGANPSAAAASQSAPLVVDNAPPSAPALSVAEGTLVNGRGVTVRAAAAGALEVFLDGDLAPSTVVRTWVPLQAAIPVTLTDLEGPHVLTALFRDGAFNQAGATPVSVDLDRTAPTGASVGVVQGGVVADPAVDLTLTASGATQVFLDGDLAAGPNVRTWLAYGASPRVALSGTDGSKAIVAQFRDGAGNVAIATAAAKLDTLPPSSRPTLAPPLGQTETKSGDTLRVGGSAEPGSTLVSARLIDGAGATVANVTSQVTLDPTTGALSGTPTVGTLSVGTVALEVIVSDGANASVGASSRSAALVVDNAPPTAPVLSLVEGSVVSSLAVTAVPGATGATEVYFDGDLAASSTVRTWISLQPSVPVTLTDLEGSHLVTAIFRDGAHNPVSATPVSVTVDRAPPSGVSVAVQQGAVVSNAAVDLTLAATGAAKVFVNGDLADGPNVRAWIDFASSLPVSLASGDGSKAIVVQFRDTAGNVALASASTKLDTAPPSSRPTLSPPVGQAQIKSGDTLRVGGSAEAGSTLVSARLIDGAGATVANVTSQVAIDPTSGALSGTPTVGALSVATLALEVIVSDGANPSVAASSRSAALVVDNAPPTAPALSLAEGVVVNALAVTALASATGATEVYLDGDLAASSTVRAWIPLQPSVPVTLTDLEGSHVVTATFRDGAYNQVGATPVSVTVDRAPPSGLSVSVQQGAVVANAAVDLTLAAAGASEVFVNGDLADGPNVRAWIDFATSLPVSLSAGDGSKAIVVQFRDVAGNVALASTSTKLDTVPPSSRPALSPPIGQAQIKSGDTLRVGGSAEVGSTLVSARLIDGAGATVANVTSQVTLDPTSGALSGTPTVGTLSVATLALEVLVSDGANASVSSASRSAALLVDNGAPTAPLLSLVEGTVVNALAVNAVASAAGATEVYLDGDLAPSGAVRTWISLQPSIPVTLTDLEGAHVITATFRDGANNQASATPVSVSVDRAPPSGLSVAVQQGSVVSDPAVDLTLAATGAAQVFVDGDLAAGANVRQWIALASPQAVTLSGADGSKAVVVQFRDAAGNVALASTAVKLDRVAPGSAPVLAPPAGQTQVKNGDTLAIGGSAEAGSTLVSARLIDASGNTLANVTSQVALDPATGALSGSPTLGATAASSVALEVIVSDGANLSVAASSRSAALGVDNAAPSAPTLALAEGTEVGLLAVTAVAAATGATEVYLDGDLVASGVVRTWVSLQPAISVTLTDVEGNHTLSALFRDGAHNQASAAPLTVKVDRVAPTGPSVVVQQGASVADPGIDLVLAAGGASQMFIDGDLAAGANVRQWIALASPQPVTLSGADGSKAVAVQFRDVAGNVALGTAAVELDRSVPASLPTLRGPHAATPLVKNNDPLTVGGGTDPRAALVAATLLSLDAAGQALGGAGCAVDVTGAVTVLSGTISGTVNTGTPCAGAFSVALRVVVRNAAGTLSDPAASVSAPVELDNAAPTGASVAMRAVGLARPNNTAGTSVTLLLAASETRSLPLQVFVGGDVALGRVGAWVDFPGTEAVPGEEPITLTPGDGSKVVTVRFRDAVGNEVAATPLSITLDTTAPPAPVATGLQLVEVSPAPNDPARIAPSNNSLVLTGLVGAAVNADRVEVYLSGGPPPSGLLATVDVGPDGSFPATTLPTNVPRALTVVALDPAGNRSQDGGTGQVRGTGVQVPNLAIESVTPARSKLGTAVKVVATSNVTLAGTPSPQVTLGGRVVGALGFNSGTGKYELTFSTAAGDPTGIGQAVVRVRGADGTSTFAPGTLATAAAATTLDYQAPVLDGTKLAVTQSNPGTPDRVSGAAGAAADDLSLAGALTVTVKAGATTLATALARADGSFGPLDIGDNAYSQVGVTLTDEALNSSPALALLNDIAPPVVAALDPDPDTQRQGQPVAISFTVTDNSSNLSGNPAVTVGGLAATYVSGTTGTSDAAAHPFAYTFTVPAGLADGYQKVEVRAVDTAGNVRPTFASVLVDKTRPVSFETTPGNRPTWNGSPGLLGVATDGGGSGVVRVEVSLRDDATGLWFDGAIFGASTQQWLPAAGTESWAFGDASMPYVAGRSYTPFWRAVDAAGNVELANTGSAFTYDATLPAAPTGLAAASVGEARLRLTWSPPGGPAPSGYLVHYDVQAGAHPPYVGVGAQQGASPVSVPAGTTTVDLTELPRGRYVVSVTALDGAGRESAYSNQSSAASRWWAWRTQPWDVADLVSTGPGQFVAVGDAGVAWRSTNGGQSFEVVPTGAGARLNAVERKGNVVVAVGNGGAIVTSTDSGRTWSKRASGTTRGLNVVCPGSARWVAAGTSGAVLTSVDGLTWTAPFPEDGNFGYYGAHCDGDLVLLGGFDGALRRSLDGGVTLPLVPLGVPNDFRAFASVGSLVYAGTDHYDGHGELFRSTDGGATFSLVASNLALQKIWTNGTDVVGLRYGNILYSSDGVNFTNVAPAWQHEMWDLAATGSGLIATGREGDVLTSSDWGRTWSVAATGLAPGGILWAAAAADTNAVAAGTRGVFARTANGGLTWSSTSPGPQPPKFNQLAAAGATIYGAGDDGTLWRSPDTGTTWEPVPGASIYGYLTSVWAGGSAVVAVGFAGNALVSSDAGQTFRVVATGLSVGRRVRGSASVIAAISDAAIATSRDGGSTWTLTNRPRADSGYENVEVSGSMVVAVGYYRTMPVYSLMHVSLDAGLTWTPNNAYGPSLRHLAGGGAAWLAVPPETNTYWEYYSTDGALTWNAGPVPPHRGWRAAWTNGAGTFVKMGMGNWAGATYPMVIDRSTAGPGGAWSSQTLAGVPTGTGLAGAGSTVLAFGAQDAIALSTDLAATWARMTHFTPGAMTGMATDGWVGGPDNMVLVSDGGAIVQFGPP